jgi:hypothetical protein
VLREPVASGVLFGQGQPRSLTGSVGRVERDPNGGLYAPDSATGRIHYAIESDARPPDGAALRADRAVPPARDGERWLALPALGPEVAALAERIAADTEGDAARVRAVERWLREKAATAIPRRASARATSARPSSASCWRRPRATASTSLRRWSCCCARSGFPRGS